MGQCAALCFRAQGDRLFSVRGPHTARGAQIASPSGYSLCPVKLSVDIAVPQDRLYIFSCLRERNRLDKLWQAGVRAVGEPCFYAAISRVVRSQCILRLALEFIHQLTKVYGA